MLNMLLRLIKGDLHATPNAVPANGTAPITVTSAAGADTYGAWVQIAPGIAAIVKPMEVVIHAVSAPDEFVLQIGTGAAAAETAVGTWRFPAACRMSAIFMNRICSGTRIAARVACAGGGAKTVNVSLSYGEAS